MSNLKVKSNTKSNRQTLSKSIYKAMHIATVTRCVSVMCARHWFCYCAIGAFQFAYSAERRKKRQRAKSSLCKTSFKQSCISNQFDCVLEAKFPNQRWIKVSLCTEINAAKWMNGWLKVKLVRSCNICGTVCLPVARDASRFVCGTMQFCGTKLIFVSV